MIQRLDSEIAHLNQRERDLDTARSNDNNRYIRRKQRDERSVKALTDIILALRELESRGSAFLQKSEHDIKFAL